VILTITAKTLIASFTAANKPYDGTTSATITARNLLGIVGSEDVSLGTSGSATFDNASVANGKTVTATGFSLSGTNAGNYSLGGVTSWTTTADISNVAPVVGPVNAPIAPGSMTTAVGVSAPFIDPSSPGLHTVVWTWGDGGSTTYTTNDPSGSGTAVGSHTYTSPGIYSISVTVTDTGGLSGSATAANYVVVYNPNGGFVTGGGWINSPAGAIPNSSLTGKATFGFVSKYVSGAKTPSGNTEFQFQAAGLNFHATLFDWLTIASARAQYKGSGTINGAGNFGFMLTAIDGDVTGGGGVDKFRIKIWDTSTCDSTGSNCTVIYDNQLGATDTAEPTTAIAGGSIVIHK
jgi:PKD repeat protein